MIQIADRETMPWKRLKTPCRIRYIRGSDKPQNGSFFYKSARTWYDKILCRGCFYGQSLFRKVGWEEFEYT